MRRILTFLLFLLFCFSSSVEVEAQNNGKKIASGMLITAAMESIGYRAQNQILTQLQGTFQELGGLIYIGVLFSIILTAGLMGSYAPVLWLLVGPPMFIYLSGVDIGGVNNRLSSSGPDWKFGPFKDSANLKEKAMRRSDTPVEVSYVFHKYNEIISEIYQEVINKITSQDVTVPILFMARQRVMEDLYSMEMRDGNALELSGLFLSQCATEMNYARTVAAGRKDPQLRKEAEYSSARDEYCRLYPLPNKKVSSPTLEEYLTKLTPPHVKGEPVSCARMWVWLRQVTVKDVAGQTESALSNAFGPEIRSLALAANLATNKVLNNVTEKLISVRPFDENVPDPCPFESGGAQTEGIISQGNSFETLAQLMSGMLIKKQQVSGRSQTAFQKILSGDASGLTLIENKIAGGVKTNVGGSEAQLRRVKSSEFATARKYETFNFLMLVPYFQGALLYVLSILYPFFAMMVLVPGKASAFFTWLALWAWVKSWDIGWAIVMVTDQILWEIMPHTTYYDLRESGNFTPVNMMEMHFSGDFSYSLSLYWMMVSMLVTSVPIITAEVILGAKKGLSGVLLGGLTDISTRLSSAAENYVATKNLGRQQDGGVQSMILNSQRALSGSAAAGQDIQNNVNDRLGTQSSMEKLGTAGANKSSDQAAKESEQEREKYSEISKQEQGK